MYNRFLRILFPELCSVCKKPATEHRIAPICTECWKKILPYEGPICKRCGKPLVSDASLTCGECINDEPAFHSARNFGIYDGVLKKAINLFKYHRIKRLSKPLSDIILELKLPRVDIIVPVSLHKNRLRKREFNQSAVLAKHIAETLGVPMVPDCLTKNRDTSPQVGLKAAERRKKIKKTFEIRSKELVEGKDIMLIDDVFTTGATVRECSKVLKKAGADKVYVITLAHSIKD